MKPKGIVLRYTMQSDPHPTQSPANMLPIERNTKISRPQDDSSEDKNLMPSLVARQQRSQNTCNNNNNNFECDVLGTRTKASSSSALVATTDQVFEEVKKRAAQLGSNQARNEHNFDQDGLILPRRVLPYVAGSQQVDTTMRDLNREIKFNQVRGKNVLDQKSELKKALEKLETNKRRKEAEQERLTRRTSLELRLEERAQRLEEKSQDKQQNANILSN